MLLLSGRCIQLSVSIYGPARQPLHDAGALEKDRALKSPLAQFSKPLPALHGEQQLRCTDDGQVPLLVDPSEFVCSTPKGAGIPQAIPGAPGPLLYMKTATFPCGGAPMLKKARFN
ncbi:hypothetical protein OEZ85_011067 [Tetradesmus obliquus]|uniref:Uncharacterized protein n=1 Tax=Tetradesmus obliquus TaxID=3088 RepID=A0ABY8TPH5_TETOB|nr:hypothetical protein OEZ85_011067 [Tetradesmus obliquus]